MNAEAIGLVYDTDTLDGFGSLTWQDTSGSADSMVIPEFAFFNVGFDLEFFATLSRKI